jgi:hypothetical protein
MIVDARRSTSRSDGRSPDREQQRDRRPPEPDIDGYLGSFRPVAARYRRYDAGNKASVVVTEACKER